MEVRVKAGEAVKAGQVLKIKLDALAAEQTAAASSAQGVAAKAAMDVASRDFDRQSNCAPRNTSAKPHTNGRKPSTKPPVPKPRLSILKPQPHTQSGFYTLTAPYAGIVADQPVSVGDMAMPGLSPPHRV